MNVERDYWIFHYGLNQYSHQCAWPASQITIECSLWFQTTLKHSTNIKSDIHSTSHYTSVSLLLIMQFRLSHLQSNGLIGTVKISNDLLIQITIIQIQFLVTNISVLSSLHFARVTHPLLSLPPPHPACPSSLPFFPGPYATVADYLVIRWRIHTP